MSGIKMLQDDVIQPLKITWASPDILVNKIAAPYVSVWIAATTISLQKDVYRPLRTDDSLDALQHALYFSLIDLGSGYWQIEVVERDRE